MNWVYRVTTAAQLLDRIAEVQATNGNVDNAPCTIYLDWTGFQECEGIPAVAGLDIVGLHPWTSGHKPGLKLPPGATQPMFTTPANLRVSNWYPHGFHLSGLAIDGSGSDQPGFDFWNGGFQFSIERCQLRNYNADAMIFRRSVLNCKLDRVDVSRCNGSALLIDGSDLWSGVFTWQHGQVDTCGDVDRSPIRLNPGKTSFPHSRLAHINLLELKFEQNKGMGGNLIDSFVHVHSTGDVGAVIRYAMTGHTWLSTGHDKVLTAAIKSTGSAKSTHYLDNVSFTRDQLRYLYKSEITEETYLGNTYDDHTWAAVAKYRVG